MILRYHTTYDLKTFIVLAWLLASGGAVHAQLPELIGIIRADTAQVLFGNRITRAGDVNNDGYDDIFIAGGRGNPMLYYGSSVPIDSMPDLRFDSTSNLFSNIGDVNGDLFDDFAVGGRSPFGWKLNLYYGGPTIDTVRDLWFGWDTLTAHGFSVLGNDLNQNGTNEILSRDFIAEWVLMFELGTDSDSILDLKIKPPNLIPAFDYSTFGESIIVGDFNGDAKRDLAISFRPRENENKTGAVYLYWGGPTFDTVPDLIIRRPNGYRQGSEFFGQDLYSLGDFNGDGFDDFYAGAGVAFDDTVNFIFYGGPNIDTIPDLTILERHSEARSAGDINADGYNDLIISYPLPFSGGGYVSIYYGGPNADSIADIHIRNKDMPGRQVLFGQDCSGVGDFNGDGFDDFAFTVRELYQFADYGTVYIFSGKSIATGVEHTFEGTLPESFSLSQNYPNPFNPSTTIEFDIVRRDHVELKVYNVLGNEVATLIRKELPAGKHTVTWDSRTGSGKQIASGIYLYRLKVGAFSQTKKMVLMK